MIEKIDKFLYKTFKRIVLRDVKKNKKHKYWVVLKYKDLVLTLMVVFVLFMQFILIFYSSNNAIGLLLFVVWCAIFGLEMLNRRLLKQLAELYDIIYSYRKIPEVYKSEKLFIKERFKEEKLKRYSSIKLYGVLSLLLFFMFTINLLVANENFLDSLSVTLLIAYLVINSFYSLFREYVTIIFDFDPPNKKGKKKENSKMTILQQKLFDRQVGALNGSNA